MYPNANPFATSTNFTGSFPPPTSGMMTPPGTSFGMPSMPPPGASFQTMPPPGSMSAPMMGGMPPMMGGMPPQMMMGGMPPPGSFGPMATGMMGPPQSFVPPTQMMMGDPGGGKNGFLPERGMAPTPAPMVDNYVMQMDRARQLERSNMDGSGGIMSESPQELQDHLDQVGRDSYPLHPEDAHLGFEPHGRFHEPGAPGHPMSKEPGIYRTVVKKPHARFEGGPSFADMISKKDSTFAFSEICATPWPESGLAPVPQVGCKTWYNSYIYVPEQRSHVERQFMERYVPGLDGEWLDVVKSRRMVGFLEEQRAKADRWKAEQEAAREGTDVEVTDYTDAYSGERLVAIHGELMPKLQLYEKYGIHKSDWGKYVDDVSIFDYDNLRTPWPFGKFDRNKKVSAHAYQWFDRRNTHIMSDKSYTMLELPSYYVDEDMYWKWRPTAESNPAVIAQDAVNRAGHLDDYPYKM